MTDYQKATGSGGLMMIRDTGWSVEMYVKAGSTSTWFNGKSFQVYTNGSYKSGTYNYPTGANWLLVYAENVSTSGGVEFFIGTTGTTGLGGPTDFWQQIDRGPVPTPPQVDSYSARDIDSTSFRTTGLHCFNYIGTLVDTMLQVNTSPDEVGSRTVQAGYFGDIYCNGLARATTYWFRMRIADNAYGWGSWNGWVPFATLSVPPSSPGLNVDTITPTSARLVVVGSADNGGAAIDQYASYVMSNNVYPDVAGAVVVASSVSGTFTVPGLTPSKQYYYTSRAHNAAGYWSAWGAMQAFTTLPAAAINVAGVWKNAIPYVCESPDVWKMAIPFKNVDGVWKQ